MNKAQLRKKIAKHAAQMAEAVKIEPKKNLPPLSVPTDIKQDVSMFKFASGKTMRAVPSRNKATFDRDASNADKIACRGKQKSKGGTKRPSGWYSVSQLAG